jgi:hypothetical protein
MTEVTATEGPKAMGFRAFGRPHPMQLVRLDKLTSECATEAI